MKLGSFIFEGGRAVYHYHDHYGSNASSQSHLYIIIFCHTSTVPRMTFAHNLLTVTFLLCCGMLYLPGTKQHHEIDYYQE